MTQRYLLCALFIFVQALASSANATPSVPIPIAPIGYVPTNDPTFSWVHETGVTTYRLQVRDLTGSNNLLLVNYEASAICAANECQIKPPGLVLPYGNQLFFRVRARNSAGWSDWSGRSNFVVQLPAANIDPVAMDDSVFVLSLIHI